MLRKAESQGYLQAHSGDDLERVKKGVLVGLWIIVNVLDCLLSDMLVQNNIGWEGNIIWSSIPVWYKMIPVIIVGFLFARKRILLPLTVGMSVIVFWNLSIFLGAR